MNELNPELNSQIQTLASLVGRKLQREGFDLDEQASSMVEALVRGAYHRLSDANLQTRLEKVVLEEYTKTAIHRRGELQGLTASLQSQFNKLLKWHTSQPENSNLSQRLPAKAANISSATDA